jgi:hypothetical protein
MRISIKKHNQAYLQELALQMGVSDITEVLNYLLLDIKGLNYKFGDKPVPTPQQAQQTSLGYSFDTSTFERIAPTPDVDRNQLEIDPVIARMASLIEEF